MSLPTELIKFFKLENRDYDTIEKGGPELKNVIKKIRTLDEFVSFIDHSSVLNFGFIQKTVAILKNEGYLISIGNTNPSIGQTIMDERLLSSNIDDRRLKYRGYDFLVEGFASIVRNFGKSVIPVIIVNENGDHDIGTSFLLFNDINLVTARHVIEKAKSVFIPDLDGKAIRVKKVTFPKNETIDIAIINVENQPFKGLKPFWPGTVQILEDVLTIGYPPVPGFNALQIFETATVNNSIKYSRGKMVGVDKSYLDDVEYMIINAKVKGGNSGGPVINKYGEVVGMVVQVPMDTQQINEIDKLGYGLVTPIDGIRDLALSKIIMSDLPGLLRFDQESFHKDFFTYNVENSNDGFKIIK